MRGADRSFAGPVLFTRSSHIVECRSDVAENKIREILPLLDRLALKWPAIPIEFGENYFWLCCFYSIDVLGEERGGAGDGRWLGF